MLQIKENSWIAKLAAKKLRSESAAIVIGDTIHLHNVTKQRFLENEKWLKHEICHLHQFKKYGRFIFVIKYMWESLKHGYYNNKYEAAARKAEED